MESVQMTEQERKEFEEFRKAKAKKEAEEKRKQQRADYAEMVDDEIKTAIPILRELSGQIKTVKSTVFGNFDTILKIKSEVLGLTKDDQRSHTFTTSDGKLRLTLGINTVDGYRDTVEDGIAIVREVIEGYAKDENSKTLVRGMLKLLRGDSKGNLKANRVLELRKMAEESGNEKFLEGVRIIEESYQPATTKKYIRAEYKDETGAWRNIPLGMTDVN